MPFSLPGGRLFSTCAQPADIMSNDVISIFVDQALAQRTGKRHGMHQDILCMPPKGSDYVLMSSSQCEQLRIAISIAARQHNISYCSAELYRREQESHEHSLSPLEACATRDVHARGVGRLGESPARGQRGGSQGWQRARRMQAAHCLGSWGAAAAASSRQRSEHCRPPVHPHTLDSASPGLQSLPAM